MSYNASLSKRKDSSEFSTSWWKLRTASKACLRCLHVSTVQNVWVDLPIKHDDAMYMKPHIQNHDSPWPVWNWSCHLSTSISNTNKEVAKLPELQTGLHCKVPPLYRIPLAMGSPRKLPWCGLDIPHAPWRSRVYLGSNSQIKFLQDKILKIYWKY